jgi:uncharacterized membrane protein YdjX (TVP38/TMEM64 family)
VLYHLKSSGCLSDDGLTSLVRLNPAGAPAIYIALYALSAIFLIPTLPFNLGAGYLWGGIWGSVIAMAGVTLGATCSFLLSRYLIGSYFLRKSSNQSVRLLQAEIEETGWKAVAFFRLNPVFPFGIMNYLFGVTSISYHCFIVTSFFSLLPATAGFAVAGDAIGGFTLNRELSGLLAKVLMASAFISLYVIVARLSARYRGKA